MGGQDCRQSRANPVGEVRDIRDGGGERRGDGTQRLERERERDGGVERWTERGKDRGVESRVNGRQTLVVAPLLSCGGVWPLLGPEGVRGSSSGGGSGGVGRRQCGGAAGVARGRQGEPPLVTQATGGAGQHGRGVGRRARTACRHFAQAEGGVRECVDVFFTR